MEKQRILVTVKTDPTLSRKYGETVCTAGVREDGTWVRIYPVPFRRLEDKKQYRKYDWLECRLVRNTADPRPESLRPVDEAELEPVGHIDTSDKWRERRRISLIGHLRCHWPSTVKVSAGRGRSFPAASAAFGWPSRPDRCGPADRRIYSYSIGLGHYSCNPRR